MRDGKTIAADLRELRRRRSEALEKATRIWLSAEPDLVPKVRRQVAERFWDEDRRLTTELVEADMAEFRDDGVIVLHPATEDDYRRILHSHGL